MWFAVSLAALAATSGCRQDPPPLEPAPVARPMPTTSPAAGGSPVAAQGEVMALVNGRPIPMARLYELLVRAQGLETGIEIVASETVTQEAQKRKVSSSEEEVQAEHERLLAEAYPSVPEVEQKDRLLAQSLAQRGWSRVRWDLICRRNVLLRKMVEPNAVVSDEMLQAEYADQFGRKVAARHIEVESLDEWERIRKLLKGGADFEQTARKFSRNPSAKDGGLLPPMSKTSPVEIPEVIRLAAVNLKEVGELSDPIKVGYAFHILRAEQIIAPASAPFEQAKDKLRAALRERVIRRDEQRLMLELMIASKYEFVDPVLKELSAKPAPAQP
jgi:parvulin-like peptidyl-prolyl isomerase